MIKRVYENPLHRLHGRPVTRRETGLLEVLCDHGVGHPMPESVEWMEQHAGRGNRGTWGLHGCDGCCLEQG